MCSEQKLLNVHYAYPLVNMDKDYQLSVVSRHKFPIQPRLSAWRPLPEAYKNAMRRHHGAWQIICRSNGTKICYHVLYIAHAKLSFVSGSDL